MSGGGSVAVHVDTGELGWLASALQALHEELAGLGATTVVDAESDQLGGWDIGSAVTDFAGGWRGPMKTLADDLANLIRLVGAAIDEYQSTERGLVQAASTPDFMQPAVTGEE